MDNSYPLCKDCNHHCLTGRIPVKDYYQKVCKPLDYERRCYLHRRELVSTTVGSSLRDLERCSVLAVPEPDIPQLSGVAQAQLDYEGEVE